MSLGGRYTRRRRRRGGWRGWRRRGWRRQRRVFGRRAGRRAGRSASRYRYGGAHPLRAHNLGSVDSDGTSAKAPRSRRRRPEQVSGDRVLHPPKTGHVVSESAFLSAFLCCGTTEFHSWPLLAAAPQRTHSFNVRSKGARAFGSPAACMPRALVHEHLQVRKVAVEGGTEPKRASAACIPDEQRRPPGRPDGGGRRDGRMHHVLGPPVRRLRPAYANALGVERRIEHLQGREGEGGR